jgi:hypothetical protein
VIEDKIILYVELCSILTDLNSSWKLIKYEIIDFGILCHQSNRVSAIFGSHFLDADATDKSNCNTIFQTLPILTG